MDTLTCFPRRQLLALLLDGRPHHRVAVERVANVARRVRPRLRRVLYWEFRALKTTQKIHSARLMRVVSFDSLSDMLVH